MRANIWAGILAGMFSHDLHGIVHVSGCCFFFFFMCHVALYFVICDSKAGICGTCYSVFSIFIFIFIAWFHHVRVAGSELDEGLNGSCSAAMRILRDLFFSAAHDQFIFIY